VDKNKYVSALLSSKYTTKLALGVAGFLLLSNTMLSYFVMTADTSEKTIVVPPVLDKPFTVQGNNLSPEYVEQMARFFSGLLLTYQKQTAKSQFDIVLHYFEPAAYNNMKARFAVDNDRISRNDLSSVFYLMSIHISQNTALFSGELRGSIGSHVVSIRQKTYELKFSYDGNLHILGFNEMRKDPTGKYQVIEPDADVMVESQEDQVEAPSAATPKSIEGEVKNESN